MYCCSRRLLKFNLVFLLMLLCFISCQEKSDVKVRYYKPLDDQFDKTCTWLNQKNNSNKKAPPFKKSMLRNKVGLLFFRRQIFSFCKYLFKLIN